MLQTLFILPSLQYIKYICFIPILTLSFFFKNLLGVLERFQKKLSLKLMKLKPRWGPINHINYCEYGISLDKWSIIFTTR